MIESLENSRVVPLVSVRLYDEGAGDPVFLDRGFSWYCLLRDNWFAPTASLSRTPSGIPHLEFLPGIGLVCRPFVELKNTSFTHWEPSGGDWEERRMSTGSPRVSRLVQFLSDPDTTWSLTSRFSAPENPTMAVSLVRADTHPLHDEETFPPFTELRIGGGEVVLHWDGRGQGSLLRPEGGDFVFLGSLPTLPGSGDPEEVLILLRHHRGRLGISMDQGLSYYWYSELDGSPLEVPSGTVSLHGQGGAAIFGFHQVSYLQGDWISPTRDTFDHLSNPFTIRHTVTPVLWPWAETPQGTDFSLQDLSDPSSDTAQFMATLIPGEVNHELFPFPFSCSPELYLVVFSYPFNFELVNEDHDTPWDGRILSAVVSWPVELQGGRCAFTVRIPRGEALAGNYRDRKVEVRLGYKVTKDGSSEDHIEHTFTGYITSVSPGVDGPDGCLVEFTVVNPLSALDTEWGPLQSDFFGGMTVNQAADYVLASEGFGADRRFWDGRGNLVVLPTGTPEDPFEMIKPREKKRDTLLRILGHAGLDLTIDTDGLFRSIPAKYFGPTVHTHKVQSKDVLEVMQSYSNPVDYNLSGTGVFVWGLTPDGSAVMAAAFDSAAEFFTESNRFTPRRRILQDEVHGVSSPGLLLIKTQMKAVEWFTLKNEPSITVFMNPGIRRLDQVEVVGAEKAGIPDETRFKVIAVQHRLAVSEADGKSSLETRVEVGRIQ